MNILDELDNDLALQNKEDKRKAFLSMHKSTFLLCPSLFKKKEDLPKLNWITFKHGEIPEGIVLPDKQGVYILSISIMSDSLPSNSYVLYVGKAGDINSNNTIKKRYRDYVNPSGYKNRVKVKKMLELWSGHLTYSFATVEDGKSTGVVEETLTSIFIPPYNQADYHADLKNLLKGIDIL